VSEASARGWWRAEQLAGRHRCARSLEYGGGRWARTAREVPSGRGQVRRANDPGPGGHGQAA
jgi:hypothetical protein